MTAAVYEPPSDHPANPSALEAPLPIVAEALELAPTPSAEEQNRLSAPTPHHHAAEIPAPKRAPAIAAPHANGIGHAH